MATFEGSHVGWEAVRILPGRVVAIGPFRKVFSSSFVQKALDFRGRIA
jgi:hypothetical protein